jgi:hypothetical protein
VGGGFRPVCSQLSVGDGCRCRWHGFYPFLTPRREGAEFFLIGIAIGIGIELIIQTPLAPLPGCWLLWLGVYPVVSKAFFDSDPDPDSDPDV